MGLQRSRTGVCRGLSLVLCAAACGSDASSGADATSTGASSTSIAGTTAFEPESSTTRNGTSESTAVVDGSGGVLDVPPRGELEPGELRPGGDTTVDEVGVGAFVQEAANLTLERRAAFEAGLQFFQLVWDVAPSTPEVDGLGPTFNAASCLGCHQRNGRALAPIEDPASVGVLLRLADARGNPDPNYGGQLQPRSNPGVPSEGEASWAAVPERDVVVPGGLVHPQRLDVSIGSMAFGPLGETTLISPRISMQLVGMGLLEAIDDADLEAWSDPDDMDGDGVSGRVARLGAQAGRFGWKAGQPTVRAQVAAAFLGDLGITSSLFPHENCPSVQLECGSAPHGGSPELTDVRLDVTAAYVRLLGVPARRGGDTDVVLRGKALFHEAGCAACHRPSFVTGTALEPELSEQRIWPYSDLLLHDLGPDLAQGGPEGDAGAAEWRTPPLWGLGLLEVVNGGRRLLHDGRARTIAEAVVWHGGEGERARDEYLALPGPDRAALDAFVDSL